MRQTQVALPEFIFSTRITDSHCVPHRKSSRPREVAAPSTHILWPKSKSRHRLLSFPDDPAFPAEASDKDIVEQMRAMLTLPCLKSSSAECLSTIKWSLSQDTKLRSGSWPERTPFTHSSFKDVHDFIRISFPIFHLMSFLSFVCSILHNLVCCISFSASFHSSLFHSRTFKSIVQISWSTDFTTLHILFPSVIPSYFILISCYFFAIVLCRIAHSVLLLR